MASQAEVLWDGMRAVLAIIQIRAAKGRSLQVRFEIQGVRATVTVTYPQAGFSRNWSIEALPDMSLRLLDANGEQVTMKQFSREVMAQIESRDATRDTPRGGAGRPSQ